MKGEKPSSLEELKGGKEDDDDDSAPSLDSSCSSSDKNEEHHDKPAEVPLRKKMIKEDYAKKDGSNYVVSFLAAVRAEKNLREESVSKRRSALFRRW